MTDYPLRMQHPAHGWTHVYSASDEASHRLHGWRDEFGSAQDIPDSAPAIAVAIADSPDAGPQKKRRGRPPKVREVT